MSGTHASGPTTPYTTTAQMLNSAVTPVSVPRPTTLWGSLVAPDIVAAALHRLTDEVIVLRTELARTREEILPRLAVLEADTKAKGAKGERRWQTRLAVILAVLALLGNFVQPFLGG